MTIRPLSIIVLLAICIAASGEVFSSAVETDANPHILETFVVTARGRESMATATPGGIGTVGSREILTRQPVGLANMAAHIPGVSMANDALWGADVNIRGLGRNRLIILIDGCRVNTATDINAQFGLIDPMEVERIEVLKGPLSALYGSGAIGGVVNIITRKPEFSETPQWQGAVSSSAANNPAGFGIYGNIAHTDMNQWVYASAARRKRTSYRDGDGDRVPNSQFDDFQGKIQLSRRWNNQNRSLVQVQRYAAGEVGIPGSGIASLPTHSDVTYPDIRRTLLQARHDIELGDEYPVSTRVNTYFHRINRNVRIDNFTGGPLAAVRPEARHDTLGAAWLNHVNAGTHHLLLGMDIWRWDYEGARTRRFTDGGKLVDQPLADSWQLSAGIFAEDDWQISDRWTANAGLRLDRITAKSKDLYRSVDPPGPLIRPGERQTDVSWNAHGGLTWFFSRQWTMTAIAASSYRAPDLLDRFKYIYFGEGNELYGNPDLDPERSVFVEAGLHHQRNHFSAGFSAFVNTLENLIVDPSPAGGIRQMENIDEARIYGVEADFGWFFAPTWRLFGNMAYARGKDTLNKRNLPFIPPLNGMAGIRRDGFQRFWSTLELEWAAKQDKPPEGVDPPDGWVTINLAAGCRFGSGRTRHELITRVDNLLNAGYRNYLSTSRGFILKEPGINVSLIWMSAF